MTHDRLMTAIRKRDEAAALALLEGDPTLCASRDEPSALMLALYQRQSAVADAIAARREALSLFEAAAIGDETRLAEHLAAGATADAVADDGFATLHLASFFAREGAVRLLLEAGADPNAVADGPGMRPLHSAAAARSLPIVKMLLAAGADPDAKQPGGFTALHAAAMHDDDAMATLLLESGADPAVRDDQGRDAAAIAREAGHGRLAERLDALVAT